MTQNGSTGELTIKQQSLLTQLLTGKSIEQAAKEVHVSERTAYRWAAEPAFKDALAKAQQALFLEHLSVLRAGIKAAIATLARNMSPNIPPNVQVTAARAWLDNAVALYKVDEETSTINLLMSPEWLSMRAKLVIALAPYAEARAAVANALSEVDGGGASNGHRQ